MKKINTIQKSYASFENYVQEQYVNAIATLNNKGDSLNEEEKNLFGYLTNNYANVSQILANYQPSASMIQLAKEYKGATNFYIIMENWCGSSAANLPYIVTVLKQIPEATITIVPRDSNEVFMDLYLTNGKKSIPKVIAIDAHENEKFVWGSSTKSQDEYALTLKEKNLEFQAFIAEMQIWFKANNAKAIEEDFMHLLKND